MHNHASGHSHDHAHAGHDHSSPTVTRKLTFAAAATFLFVVLEMAIGAWSGSLALISDSIHNLTDTAALLLALFALLMERRPATHAKTYGYQKAGILAAFINSAALAAFTLFIFWEAVVRLRHPEPVNSGAMLITAAFAIVLNGGITMLLHGHGRDDINIRSAVIHMIGDAISSGGIVIAALVIRMTGSSRWDPGITLLIAVLILWSSWGILKETVNLLLEGTPGSIDPNAVSDALAALEGVQGVHHLHIWALGPSRPALSCHLMVGDIAVRTTGKLLDEVTAMLRTRYGIQHATVQFEFSDCSESDPYCVPYTSTM